MRITSPNTNRTAFAFALVLLLAGIYADKASASTINGFDESVQFPSKASAERFYNAGTYPLLENLRNISVGLNKEQTRLLLSNPIFHEGYAAVRNWNYIFNFKTENGVLQCQYEIFWDEHMRLQDSYFSSQECADLLNPVVKPPVVVKEEKPIPPVQKLVLPADDLFDFDKAILKDEGKANLKAFINQFDGHPYRLNNLIVTGYTDQMGSVAYNEKLAQKRADAVKQYILSLGYLSDDDVYAIGMGKANPKIDCLIQPLNRDDTIACGAQNRRVEIKYTLIQEQ